MFVKGKAVAAVRSEQEMQQTQQVGGVVLVCLVVNQQPAEQMYELCMVC
jgi:hypothetical protein